ncbi:acyl-CoA synthetase [Novispirillum itersonii]|uniref:Acetyl-CoA synthetase n=1 Tax=Novispirillum itersonii TaxID=189 RepID=A0A7W9ZF46_NOVIT|nr:acyl-CoA synthetase [Novispirillum itersonii]MBB6209472.1 acetyl-CoA synthetase [Novispirillum itersonii]
MLDRVETWAAGRAAFRWVIPERYNIGVDICDRHAAARPQAPAVIIEEADGSVRVHDFAGLKADSDRLASALRGKGIQTGDRIGIFLPQSYETVVSHIAAYKLGAVAVPLFTLFGPEALSYRLNDCGAAALITDAANRDRVLDLRADLPGLRSVLCVGGGAGTTDFWDAVALASDGFVPVETLADDPAVIIYTSGTTGKPKGALHAHRVLLGHLPGVELPHEFFPQPDDLFWTPADWAWIGGLIDVLLPSLHHGIPVLAHRARKFDPEEAFALMARHRVRNVFMPPTALKLMRQVENPRGRFDYRLRSIGSGGETLGAELIDWAQETFGLTLNEFYGQTECNLIVGNCAAIAPVKPGSMGQPIFGHDVAVIDAGGSRLPAGQTGSIAVRSPDPVMFLRYWNNPQATEEKFVTAADGTRWLLTGDLGQQDSDGYLWFLGRDDDVITSAGYRIGPGEIEDALLKHPAVAMAAAVGVPDPVRTEIVKAFVVLKDGWQGDAALAEDIQMFIKTRMAAHAYPRAVEFMDSLPMTPTGKIRRRDLRERENASV